jgi:hypothetical protein
MHPQVEAQDHQHQDSEEIDVIIEDELARLHQEIECLWLVQEQMAEGR